MNKRMSPAYLQRFIRLFIFCLLIPTTIYAQEKIDQKRVSLNVKNKQLGQVLEDITLQTGLYFTYDASLIPTRDRISLQINNLDLGTVLDTLFRDPSLSYRIIDKNVVLYRKEEAPSEPDKPDSLINTLIVTGHISDLRSGRDLPYATIALVGSSIGTISNLNGEFKLKLPANSEEPILVFSFIGYKSVYLPVNTSNQDDLKIRMERDLISLQEVVIRLQDPIILLHEAVRRINQNYLDVPSSMTGFYRESVQRNNKYIIFSEAVLDIAKCSYNAPGGLDRSRIYKGRKITNVGIEDTVLLKISSGINSSLQLDIVKNIPDFLTGDFEDRYDFIFSDIVTFKNKLAYEISFRQKDNIDETLYTGRIYLDQYSLAIVAADFELDPERIGREQNMFVIKKSRHLHLRPITASYYVEYGEHEGRYYFSQARAEVKFRLRKKREWMSSQYSTLIELAITNVEPGRNNSIKPGDALKPRTVLSDEKFEYDPGFWGDYNTIVPEASLQEALRMIEKQLQELQLPEEQSP